MRLHSKIWVSAYIRQVAQAGAFAVVVRSGEATAGAIYIKIALLDGTARLYSPALILSENFAMERAWQLEFGDAPLEEREVDAFLKSQISFDADLWVIEVEDREGRHFLADQVQDVDL